MYLTEVDHTVVVCQPVSPTISVSTQETQEQSGHSVRNEGVKDASHLTDAYLNTP